jgi:hypothetical protein
LYFYVKRFVGGAITEKKNDAITALAKRKRSDRAVVAVIL